MTRSRLALVLLLAACTGLDPTVLYRCESGGTCLKAGYACWSDGYCHPSAEPPRADAGSDAGGPGEDAGADAGTVDGGALDAGVPDGGPGDGGAGDGGAPDGGPAGTDAGSDGGVDAGPPCVPATACPGSATCGFIDAGCGLELRCGFCGPGQECGALSANTCAPASVCLSNGWCPENPLPQFHTLRGVYAADARHTWWVGDDKTVLFWDGQRHRFLDLPVSESVDFFGVHGTSATNVFVVGTGGTVVHWDGTSWTVETVPGTPKPDLRAVWVAPSGVAVAVGTGSALLRRASPGSPTWTANAVGGTFTFDDVTQGADGRFVAVGEPGPVVALEQAAGSSSWVTVPGPSALVQARSVWSAPDGGLFVAGATDGGGGSLGAVALRSSGGGWSTVATTSSALSVVRGRTADDWFAGGEGGALLEVQGGVPALLGGTGGAWTALALLPGYAMAEGEGGQVGRVLDTSGTLEVLSTGGRDDLNALCGDLSPTVNLLRAPATSSPGCTGPSCRARFYERVRDGGSAWVPVEFTMADTGKLVACHQLGTFVWMLSDGTRYATLVVGPNVWLVNNLATQGLPAATYTSVWAPDLLASYFVGPSQPAGGSFIARATGTFSSPVFTALPYDGGGDVTTTIAGDGVNTFALGTFGLVLQLQPDGGFAPLPRLGVMQLTAGAGETLPDGGTLFVAAGLYGSAWHKEGAGGFVQDGPFPASFSAAWVAPTGDAFLAGTDTVGGGRTQARFYRRLAGASFRPQVLIGHFTPTGLFGAATDAGTRVWVTGAGGVVLRKDY